MPARGSGARNLGQKGWSSCRNGVAPEGHDLGVPVLQGTPQNTLQGPQRNGLGQGCLSPGVDGAP